MAYGATTAAVERPARISARAVLLLTMPSSAVVLFPLRLQRAAQFVGERTEPFGRRTGPGRVVAQFLGILRVENGFAADADAPCLGIHLENDDVDARSDGEGPGDVAFFRDARFAVRHQRVDSRRELDEYAELCVTGHTALVHLTRNELRGRRRPRILGQLLQPQRDLPSIVVDAQHLDGELFARLE